MKTKVLLVAALVALVASLGVAQDFTLSPTFGSVELEAGFFPDPHTVSITAGGSIDLSALGFYGFVADAPDYDLYYEGDGLTLYIYVEFAEDDTVLLVNAPDGQWHFSDDEMGLNPGIEFPDAQSGLYDIWVGTFSEDLVQSSLAISEIGFDVAAMVGSGPDWTLDPTYGTLELSSGFADDPRTISLTAGGREDISSLGFYGFVATAPDLDLYYEAGSFSLYIYVSEQSQDTVLLINDPNGEWYYSDDEIGSQPGIEFSNPPTGLYSIWVGTFGDGMTSAELSISEFGW